MSEKMSVCPFCKKNNAVDAKFCSYCGKQFTSNVETADTNTSFSNDATDNNSQKTENGVSDQLKALFYNMSIVDTILFIGIVVFSLMKSFTILGTVRGIGAGFWMLYCKDLLSRKRYIAFVLMLIFGFLIDIVFRVFMR